MTLPFITFDPEMKRLTIVLSVLLNVALLSGQSYTLSGNVTDVSTGEDLLFATVAVVGTVKAAATNQYGFYALTLPAGRHTIRFSYIGYESDTITVDLTENSHLDISLKTSSIALREVKVVAGGRNADLKASTMGIVGLDIREISRIPVLFGEQDLLKTIQLMPGVSPNSEGGSGFFVRGGNLDQNLILLDEAPVYNASHLLGFFSVFNGNAIKDIKLYKGTHPAMYGGRASSVMDVRMKDGNNKEWGASGGIGLISSRLTVEGPVKEDKGSVIISARRTYLDIVLGLIDKDYRDIDLYFYDLNIKATWRLSDKDRLFASGYLGRDILGLQGSGFNWGNKTFTLRWNHIFNNNLFSNTSLIYSDYNYGFLVENAGLEVDLDAGIYDYNLKQDYSWFVTPGSTIGFGWNMIYHSIKPSLFSFNNLAGDFVQKRNALEGGLYAESSSELGSLLKLNYGLRLSTFSNAGPYTEKKYDSDDNVISQESYDKGDIYHTYLRLEPRITATLLINESSSAKISYNRNNQYLHLLTNSTSGAPTDIWIASSPQIKPASADQYSAGLFKSMANEGYKLGVEAYYKKLSNLPDYENGADYFGNPDLEAELVSGRGRAYGLELLAEKNQGLFTGWIAYTIGKSERQIDEINSGSWFSARQDRTHDISVVGMYQVTPRLNISASWIFITGDAVTFPVGKYYIDQTQISLYSDRNGSRMPDYHRLDMGITWTLKQRKNFSHDINLSVYNAYNRKNAYSITFSSDENGAPVATRLSLFGIVPSLTWNFRF